LIKRPGLFWNDSTPQEVEIGYTIRRVYWKKGIETEACRFLLVEFKQLNVSHLVVARIEPENEASIHLANKLGFQKRDSKRLQIAGNPNPMYEYILDLNP